MVLASALLLDILFSVLEPLNPSPNDKYIFLENKILFSIPAPETLTLFCLIPSDTP
jgi:hypothetical protein